MKKAWFLDGNKIKSEEGGNTWTIAEMSFMDNPNINQDENARLIVSAPDLLAAAQQVVTDQQIFAHGGRVVGYLKHMTALADAVRKANNL